MRILLKSDRKTIEFLDGTTTINANDVMWQTLQVELETPLVVGRESLWVTYKNAEHALTLTQEHLLPNNYTELIPSGIIKVAGDWTLQLFVRQYDSVSGSYVSRSASDIETFTVAQGLPLDEEGNQVTNETIGALYKTAQEKIKIETENKTQIDQLSGKVDAHGEEITGLRNTDISHGLQIAEHGEKLTEHGETITKNASNIERLRYDLTDLDTKTSVSIAQTQESVAQNTSDIEGLRQDIENESHFRGYVETNAEVQALQGTTNDYAYSAESGTVWIYSGASWFDSQKTVPDQMTPASNTTPLMDGTPSVGTESAYARGDHRHPTDTTRLATSEKGAPNGVASLDENGKVPYDQLPDDIGSGGGSSEGGVSEEYVNSTVTMAIEDLQYNYKNDGLLVGSSGDSVTYNANGIEFDKYVDDNNYVYTVYRQSYIQYTTQDGSVIMNFPKDKAGEQTLALIEDVDNALTEYVKKTDYGNASAAGVYRATPTYGAQGSIDGYLQIAKADKSEIAAKGSGYKPIVPNTLDYAVKVGITTNTETLTDDEKAAACAWLGINLTLADALLDITIDGTSISFYTKIPEFQTQNPFAYVGATSEDGTYVVIGYSEAIGYIVFNTSDNTTTTGSGSV